MRNSLVLALALSFAGACHASAPSLEQLVKTCQEKSGRNFTYAPETATILREHTFRLEGGEPATPDAWLDVLRGALAQQGLELERIGPEHISVWLVRARKQG